MHDFLLARGRSSRRLGLEVARGPSRATMVLLPKQVHLQKDVGAGLVSAACVRTSQQLCCDLLAARVSDRKANRATTTSRYRLMVGVTSR